MAAVTAPTIFDLGGLEFSGAVVPPPPPQGPQLAGHAHSSTSFYTASGMLLFHQGFRAGRGT